jgi:hypothetical protein
VATIKIAGSRPAYNRPGVFATASQGTPCLCFTPSKWRPATRSWACTSNTRRPNPKKVNLGVGVYYDDNGKLPLLECVQKAEEKMMAAQCRPRLPADRWHRGL